MTNRPCKPDAGVKRLWQLLLPGTAFPACGVVEKPDTGDDARPPGEERRQAPLEP